jgi:hypothetical protein
MIPKKKRHLDFVGMKNDDIMPHNSWNEFHSRQNKFRFRHVATGLSRGEFGRVLYS